MTFCLDSTIIEPEKNKDVKNIVVLFHGYGGDGNDISMLALNWKRHMSNTIFICPNGHEQCSYLLEAKDFLLRENINVDTHLIKNCGHHIPVEASSIALNYILKKI